tara:strand:+ start:1585 stop:2604 length:1020 start_codon:yes stop_codon:yes gene_type:complete
MNKISSIFSFNEHISLKIKIIKKIGALALGFIIIEIFLMFNSHRFFIKDYQLKKSIDSFNFRKNDVDLLFLGASGVYAGVNPDDIKINNYKIHNFGFPSESIQTTYYKINHYINNNDLKNLKVVVLEIRKGYLYENNKLSVTKDLNYSQYYDLPDILNVNGPREFLSVFLHKINLFRLRKDFINQFKINMVIHEEKIKENGYALRKNKIDRKYLKDQKNFLQNLSNRGLNSKCHPVPIYYYKKLIELLNDHDVRVFLIQLPGAGVLLENEDNSHIYDFSEQKMLPVVQSYFSDIPFLNYAESKNEWVINDFSDRGHLNYIGAKKLGKLIQADLQRILSR